MMKFYDLWPFYLSGFTRSLIKIIRPFETLYYLGIGLSYTQVATIMVVKSLVTLVFEIPTSKFAEKYGNKCSVIVGNLFSGIFMVLIPFVSQFGLILLLSGVISFFNTFFSGSDKAWVGEVIRQKYPKFLTKYFGYSKSINNFGIAFVGILGTFIVQKTGSMGPLWIFAGLGYILAGLVLLFGKTEDVNDSILGEKTEGFALLREYYGEGISLLLSSKNEKVYLIKRKGRKLGSVFSFLTMGMKELLKNKKIIYLFIGLCILSLLRNVGKMFWGPYFQQNGFEISKLGWLSSISALLGIIVPMIIPKLKTYNNWENYFLLFFVILGISILLSLYLGNLLLLVVAYLIYKVIEDFISPLDNSLSVDIISKKSRSVILSMRESVKSGFVVVGGLLIGVIFDNFSLIRGGVIIFLLIVLLGVNYVTIVKKHKTETY